MRGAQRLRDLDAVFEALEIREGSAHQTVTQRLTLEQLRDDVGDAGLGANVEYGEDVGVVQAARGSCFTGQALHVVRVRRQGRVQHLESDVAPETRIACPVDLAHASGAERRHDLVGAEMLPG